MVIRTHRERESYRLPALGNMVAGIYVEQFAILQIFSSASDYAFLKISDRDLNVADQSYISCDRRESGQWLIDGQGAFMLKQGIKAQLRAVNFTVEPVVCANGRIDLPENADAAVSCPYFLTSPGMIGGIVLLGSILYFGRISDSEPFQDRLNIAF